MAAPNAWPTAGSIQSEIRGDQGEVDDRQTVIQAQVDEIRRRQIAGLIRDDPDPALLRILAFARGQVRRAAKRRVAEAQAQKALETYGHPIEVDPITVVVGELQRTAGVVAWLHLLIEDLTPKVAAQSAWVEVYRQERRHLVEVSATAIKCGIQERQVALAERRRCPVCRRPR